MATSDRKPFEWEVKLQSPDGKEITEKVLAFWSPSYDGVKESIALAARLKAWIRNKKKIEFQVLGDPVLIGRAS
jgi:hypothetical protein